MGQTVKATPCLFFHWYGPWVRHDTVSILHDTIAQPMKTYETPIVYWSSDCRWCGWRKATENQATGPRREIP